MFILCVCVQGAAGIGQKKMETLKRQLHTDDNC